MTRRVSRRSTRAASSSAVVSFCGLDLAGRLEPPSRVARLGVDAGELHLRGGEGGARLLELVPEVDLRGASGPQLLAERTGPRRTCVNTRAERRLEPLRGLLRGSDAVGQSFGEPHERGEQHGVDRRRAPPGTSTESAFRRLGPSCGCHLRLGRFAEARLELAPLGDERARRPWSSSNTASAVSPENQSSPREGS